MNIAVRYYTRSGNTKKLASAVADAVSAEAKDITAPLTEKVNILFLGCSYYAFDVDEAVKQFIVENKDYIGKIVCFGTSAMMKSMKKPMTKITDANGIALAEEEFHCRGEFKFANKGRPNTTDLEAAKEFAKRIIANG